MSDPRFPVGPFVPPEGHDPALCRAATQVIAEFPERMASAVAGLDDAQLDTPYREGGWTVRQVVHHTADSHLNATMRFRLALTETEPRIVAYDEKAWAELADVRTLPVAPSLELLRGLHERWATLLASLDEAAWRRTLIHPEHARPLPLWWMAGLYEWHSRHHVAHVTRLRAREGW